MFDEINYIADSVYAFEERKLLRQVISNGVGYRFQRPELCQEVIIDYDARAWDAQLNAIAKEYRKCCL